MMDRKIKIVFLHWCLVCGGAESALLDLVKLLNKEIFDITIFAIYGGGEWTDRFRDVGVKVIDSFSCISAGSNIFDKAGNFLKSKQIQYILKHGGKGLLKTCTRNDFDLIVSYHLGPGLTAAGFSGTAKTIRYIHGDANTNLALRAQIQALYRENYHYDKVICVSECAKKAFETYFSKPANVVSCHNPIDSKKILSLAAEKPGIEINGDYICAVGRLVEAKGYLRLIRIFGSIVDEVNYSKLVIVGEGPERTIIEREISKLHLEDKVVLVGYSANPYPYIANARFCVCSSYTEGLHIASMESLLLGVPVLSIFPTVAELLGEEPCGIIVDSEDQFAHAMKAMLLDDLLYANMKSAAGRRSSYFLGEKMVKAVEDEYIKVIDTMKL